MSRLSPPGLVVLVLGLAGAARAATALTESFTSVCPSGSAVGIISSVYDNATQDRTWEFGCQEVYQTNSVQSCRIYPPANKWNTDMNFRCQGSGHYISGMTSIYDNDSKDRVFVFVCCFRRGKTANCELTNYVNEYGGPMNISWPNTRVLRGVDSVYSSSTGDRIWRFEVCDHIRGLRG